MQKNIPEALLALLSDGQFHSGVAIGELLGVSRAAVWKRLQKLEALGLELESVKGKGYRLIDAVQALSPADISDGLPAFALQVFHELDSTNAEILRQLAISDVASGAVVVAELQSAGRGRRGRPWVSPFGKNLYFSMAWNFSNGAAALEGLSLVVGLSVVQALQALGLADARLKWPNDVLVNNKKLAGVLLEIAGDASGLCHVVIGVGLNVNMRAEDSQGIDQAWTSMSECLQQRQNRSVVLNGIIKTLIKNVAVFERQGMAPFIEEWARYDAFAGKGVVVSLADKQIFGVAEGIDEKGLLLLNVNGRQQRFNGGEVSLRRVF